MNVRNYIHLTGNLGAAPTTFVLPSGDLSCSFSIATNEYYRNKEGEKVTRTEWHRVKAYGKLAELFAEHLEKGSQISIVGSMRYRKWTDKFEQPRIAAEVIASEFTFLGSGRKPTEATAPADEYDAANVSAIDAEIDEMMGVSATAAEPADSRTRKKTATRRSKSAKAA